MVNQYFGLTVPQTLKSWTAMKMISSLVGITAVFAAHWLLP
jgi:H+/gluconate symporter-like permease